MFDNNGIMYAGTQATDDDKRLFVQFSVESRLDKKATAESNDGLNKYRNVEFITIRIPGDKTVSIHRPVVPSDKVRFALQYAAFKNSTTGEQIVGTPLALWPGCSPSQAQELQYFNVRTVEQLAAMPDGAGAANMMGVQALKQAARSFLQHARENAPIVKMQAELAQRDNVIAAQAAQLKDQGDKLDAILARLASDDEGKSKKGK